MSESSLLRQLRQTDDPNTAHDLALALLNGSPRREAVDAALHTLQLAQPDANARPALRTTFTHYAQGKVRDSGGLVREKIVRLLLAIDDPNDLDIYLTGIHTYERQPVTDTAQNLRAAALVGVAMVNPELGHFHAVRLLSELDDVSRFNGEPALTAINLLAQQGQTLLLYQFLLLAGLDALEAGQNELLGKALESLGEAFPVALYRELADLFTPRDRALVNMGIVTHIVEHRVTNLYPLLDTIMTSTRHTELHHYGAVMLAASRDAELTGKLFQLAKTSPRHRIGNFLAALELVPGEQAREIATALRQRQA